MSTTAPAPRIETLTWDGMEHTLVLTEDDRNLRGQLTIRKKGGVLELPLIIFPVGMTLTYVLDRWRNYQHGKWTDWRHGAPGSDPFFATRKLDLGEYVLIWYIVHQNNAPLDAWALHKKPPTKA